MACSSEPPYKKSKTSPASLLLVAFNLHGCPEDDASSAGAPDGVLEGVLCFCRFCDVLAVGRVCKRLHKVLLDDDLTATPAVRSRTNRLWAALGPVLAEHAVRDPGGAPRPRFLGPSPFEAEDQDLLIARTAQPHMRRIFDLEFADAEVLRERATEMPGDEEEEEEKEEEEEEEGAIGAVWRLLCFHLARAQTRPVAFYRARLAAHDALDAEAGRALGALRMEGLLREQLRPLVAGQDASTAAWGEFACAGAVRVTPLGRPDAGAEPDDASTGSEEAEGGDAQAPPLRPAPGADASRSREQRELAFLARTLVYEDLQLVSSQDWNAENYKWDVVVGLRCECVVLGRHGTAAHVRMRARSDHTFWSCGTGLECMATLLPNRSAVVSARAAVSRGVAHCHAAFGNPALRPQRWDFRSREQDRGRRPRGGRAGDELSATFVVHGACQGSGTLDSGRLTDVSEAGLVCLARALGLAIAPAPLWRFLVRATVPRLKRVAVVGTVPYPLDDAFR